MGRSSVTSPPGVTDASPLFEPVLLCRCPTDPAAIWDLSKAERPSDGGSARNGHDPGRRRESERLEIGWVPADAASTNWFDDVRQFPLAIRGALSHDELRPNRCGAPG